MPTREAIVSTVAPREAEKPIPVRMVSTRATPRPQNLNQPTTAEGLPAADSATPAESVRLSPQLTALARKEQAYRQREQALKEREKQLEAKLSEADQYSQLKTKFQAKDFSAAEELGMSYEEYTKYLLDKQAGEDPQAQAFKSLEKEIQDLKKGQEEKAIKEYEATVAEYKTELSKLAESNPEFARVKKFKDIDDTGKEISGVDVALQFILDSFEEDSKEVSIDEAMKLTEAYLKERSQKWAALNEESEPKVEPEPRALPPPKTDSRTLSQQMQPSGQLKRPARSLQHMSEQERYAEARRRVEERLKLEGKY